MNTYGQHRKKPLNECVMQCRETSLRLKVKLTLKTQSLFYGVFGTKTSIAMINQSFYIPGGRLTSTHQTTKCHH